MAGVTAVASAASSAAFSIEARGPRETLLLVKFPNSRRVVNTTYVVAFVPSPRAQRFA